MSVKATDKGERQVRGINCRAWRVTGSYLRPFTVYQAPDGTVFYLRYTDAGRAILRNDSEQRYWLGAAIRAAGGLQPTQYQGV